MNAKLERLLGLIATTACLEENLFVPASPLIKLAESVLPIIKLARLFINKLSKWETKNTKFPLFTEMPSSQLENLKEVPNFLETDIRGLLVALEQCKRAAVAEPQDATTIGPRSTLCLCFAKTARLFPATLEPVSLVLPHLLPRVPDNDGFPSRDDYTDWLKLWTDQFGLAIRHLQITNYSCAPRYILDNYLIDLNEIFR
ncbi:hypothetical protein PtA15_14A334 [Puccinia triticina]|uniref:Uncharacterized protein n=1 Tax=Puccinia triticina TaxID=208348 RepID=A0ABY7D2J2_9BASI|nr:uncharacterized protein PtA15_14A334 [Puccinia triticina]WAQ91450.1 hypothetical protein PtA15_14A334 [Puccinia triticina]